MTTATRAVRDQSFQPLECDIPNELTIAEYRDRRRPPSARRPRRRRRIAALLRR
jgi:hypothetical protein